MTDAACFELVFNLLVFIVACAFYRLIAQAARAIIILSCSGDHGHGEEHALPCDCACHRVAKT